MKAVIQRVTKASVSVDGEVISNIGNGLCVLIGIKRDDTMEDMKYIVKKVLNTKIFDGDNEKKWCASIVDKQYEILCISQFTLYHTLKGNRLDFHKAMSAQESEPFYNKFLAELGKSYKPELIKDGKFGAMMEVNIQNSGPVTLEIESPIKPNESNNCQ
ncbi:D-aminoacyl-tRNA deacylase 1-like isoform X4 [Osmia lignaria lignaria]|uniref:D-aminoacyl-tRNA deacylase 1-like isoform X4 n=1 Tax=Osmia bicornis bicornis TaxID=1437191 RepID=UPI001478B3D0|nr:D-aminoacyl-tRNA deacylase 1-like isoform X4 [Osmia bicornis bicornis]XP_034171285.1 D-aminoacyl-tRNA deacylase 1-like isoform X2 [Osmia lignaria]